MATLHQYDFCVLGAASAGFSAAQGARELDKSLIFADIDRTVGWSVYSAGMYARQNVAALGAGCSHREAPQIGIAAPSERRAQAQKIWYDKAKYPFAELGRAIIINATDGDSLVIFSGQRSRRFSDAAYPSGAGRDLDLSG